MKGCSRTSSFGLTMKLLDARRRSRRVPSITHRGRHDRRDQPANAGVATCRDQRRRPRRRPARSTTTQHAGQRDMRVGVGRRRQKSCGRRTGARIGPARCATSHGPAAECAARDGEAAARPSAVAPLRKLLGERCAPPDTMAKNTGDRADHHRHRVVSQPATIRHAGSVNR